MRRALGVFGCIALLLLIPHGTLGASPSGRCGKWERLPQSAFRDGFAPTNMEARSQNNLWVIGQADGVSGVEHRGPNGWRYVNADNPGDQRQLTDLSLVPRSSDIWAVGIYSDNAAPSANAHALVERRSEAGFEQVRAPDPGPFTYMWAIDSQSEKNAWIVGSYYDPEDDSETILVEHWNGTRWIVQHTPNPRRYNTLYAVDAISRKNVWAAGSMSNRDGRNSSHIFLHYDGKRWRRARGPGPLGTYVEMAERSPRDVWAVSDVGLVGHYNGDKWRQVRARHMGQDLLAVTSSSRTSVWAAGSTRGNHPDIGPDRLLLLHWNGKSWKRIRTRDPKQYEEKFLDVAAVPNSRQVWLIGYYTGNKAGNLVLHRC